MSEEKKSTPKTVPVFDSVDRPVKNYINGSGGGRFGNRGPTIGDPQVRSHDGFVTRNAAPPPISDIHARPKDK